jgi:hypothetical protein
MIDEKCPIWTQGKGFCWCPSSAWGVTDEELCELCQIKNAQIIEKIEIIARQPKVLTGKRIIARSKSHSLCLPS